jgi:hypothetical protein
MSVSVPTELVSAVIGAVSGGGVVWITHRQDVSRQRVQQLRETLLKLLDLREQAMSGGAAGVQQPLQNQRRARNLRRLV